jgi:hypothetical protein
MGLGVSSVRSSSSLLSKLFITGPCLELALNYGVLVLCCLVLSWAAGGGAWVFGRVPDCCSTYSIWGSKHISAILLVD